jgi:hypothetical protein
LEYTLVAGPYEFANEIFGSANAVNILAPQATLNFPRSDLPHEIKCKPNLV